MKMTKYSFPTTDRDRYFIYVHYAFTGVDKPTSPFRFFVDDGSGGNAGSSGGGMIQFTDPPPDDGSGNGDNGNGNGNQNGNSNGASNGSGDGDSGANGQGSRLGEVALLFLLSSFLLL